MELIYRQSATATGMETGDGDIDLDSAARAGLRCGFLGAVSVRVGHATRWPIVIISWAGILPRERRQPDLDRT